MAFFCCLWTFPMEWLLPHLYVFHTKCGHNMHRFWDISPNRSQWSKLDFPTLTNYQRFHRLRSLAQYWHHPTKLLHAQNIGQHFSTTERCLITWLISTTERCLITWLISTTERCLITWLKMWKGQNLTFSTVKGFTECRHHHMEAPCQNRRKFISSFRLKILP